MCPSAKQKALYERRRNNKNGRVFLKRLEEQFEKNVSEVLGARRESSSQVIAKALQKVPLVEEVQLDLVFEPAQKELFS